VGHRPDLRIYQPYCLFSFPSKQTSQEIQQYVDRYNNVRLQSAIGYVTPKDMLAGRQVEIHTERDRKLEAARQQRQSRRQQAA
jgi:hypothetical protein